MLAASSFSSPCLNKKAAKTNNNKNHKPQYRTVQDQLVIARYVAKQKDEETNKENKFFGCY